MRRSFTTLALIAVTANAARAAELHVPGEYATIGSAIAAAAPGDTIRVAAGSYSASSNGESFPLELGSQDLVLLGDGMEQSIVDAEGTDSVIRISGAGGVRVSGFTLTGGGSAVWGGGVRILDSSPEIDHNLIRNNGVTTRGSGIFANGSSQAWIHHNVLWENFDFDFPGPGDPHGIDLLDSTGGVVEHNLIGRGDSNGLFYQNASGPVIRHNIFFENGTPGLRGRGICAFGTGPAVIAHNLFFGNAIADLLVSGVGDITAAEANDLAPDDDIYGNLTADPLLVDPDGGDYHLQPGSPAIDAGDPTLPPDPDGTIADIGPFFFDQDAVDATVLATRAVTPELWPVAPNPLRSDGRVRLSLPAAASVRVDVVDVRGRRVITLHEGPTARGAHEWSWRGRDEAGRPVAAGVYLVRARVGARTSSRTVVLLR